MAEKKGAGGKNQPYNEANGEYEKKHRQKRSYSDIPKSEKLKEAIKIYSDDSGKDLYESGITEQNERKPRVEKAKGFNRLETKHHIRHAKEMGFKNTKEYEKAAVEFFNSDIGTLYYSLSRKRFYRYDERSQRLAISSNGIIHTFLKETKKEFERIRRQDKLNGL